jgi:hypothetical protein
MDSGITIGGHNHSAILLQIRCRLHKEKIAVQPSIAVRSPKGAIIARAAL